MQDMEANSVDAVVSDPPYGLAFMDRSWDDFEPKEYQAFCQKWGEAALHVLKPGAHLLAFSGTRTYHRMVTGLEDAGFTIRDQIAWMYGNGFPKGKDLGKAAGGTWDGWNTSLKPAHEPVVVAQKPKQGTYAENVLEHGVGGLNIDGCRIPVGSEGKAKFERRNIGRQDKQKYGDFEKDGTKQVGVTDEGRWPPNVVLDEQAAAQLDEQCEDASRFFYCGKAGRSERNAGLDEDNDIATLKPLSVMRWLVRLVTPEDGVVLDPFAGSGTTACAAVIEGMDYILIEKRDRFANEIAPQRIDYWSKPEHWEELKDHNELPDQTEMRNGKIDEFVTV